MKRKSSARSTTATIETPITPKSWIENATPPIEIGRVENGPWNCFAAPPQIQVVAPLIRIRSPIVRMTTTMTGAVSTGRMTVRSIATPAEKAITRVATKAGQKPRP